VRWPDVSPEERFWAKAIRTGGDECWLWTGTKVGRYGQFVVVKQTRVYAHRFAYELAIGPIPDGLEIDHICHNCLCVNPRHLRAVTRKQNQENLSGPMSTSKTGVRGVYRHGERWRAEVGHNRQKLKIGIFDTLEQAERAVRAKRLELFTHNDLDRHRHHAVVAEVSR
jgi:hypothetical protein